MSIEFQKAIEKKRILHFAQGKRQVKNELEEAESDLTEALIYSKGYREKSHYYLLVALNSLFVKDGLLSEELASEFHDAIVLREDADYHGNFTEEGADSVLRAAKELLAAAKTTLKIK